MAKRDAKDAQRKLHLRQEFGRRLLLGRREKAITQESIAGRMKISKQLVSHWETGRSEITVFDAVRLAAIIGVDIGWLLTGVVGHEVAIQPVPESGVKTVPRIKQEDALRIAAGQLDFSDVRERDAWSVEVTDSAMSFVVADRSMEPRFNVGDRVLIDSSTEPEPGDCVLVVLPGEGNVLFRRYKPSATARPGKPPYTLLADNSMFPERDISVDLRPVFFGTLRAHTISCSR